MRPETRTTRGRSIRFKDQEDDRLPEDTAMAGVSMKRVISPTTRSSCSPKRKSSPGKSKSYKKQKTNGNDNVCLNGVESQSEDIVVTAARGTETGLLPSLGSIGILDNMIFLKELNNNLKKVLQGSSVQQQGRSSLSNNMTGSSNFERVGTQNSVGMDAFDDNHFQNNRAGINDLLYMENFMKNLSQEVHGVRKSMQGNHRLVRMCILMSLMNLALADSLILSNILMLQILVIRMYK